MFQPLDYIRALGLIAVIVAVIAVGIWLKGVIEDRAVEDVRDANQRTTEEALRGTRDGESCRAAGGVWQPASGGGGECVPVDD